MNTISNKNNNEKLHKNEQIAAFVHPIMIAIDFIINDDKFNLEDMEDAIHDMREHNGFLEAWPFPETMRKADEQKATLNTFEAIIDLLKARMKQVEEAKKPDITLGAEVLRQLGF